MRYDFKRVEAKWQKKWEKEKTFAADDASKKPKYYQLETFPYPSASGLHIGHPKGYIAEDIHARYMRMQGREVLYTMGWDAFGLPTENYAIKVGKNPRDVAVENIKNFKRQVQMFGFSYDWDREITTSDPAYYRWTQWLFVQLFKRGLAYRKKANVNWCSKDQTVLANEQVVEGKCERCGTVVEQREMEQWFLKITDYADRLLSDLKRLDWPLPTIKRQENWIGKSEGALIGFRIKGLVAGDEIIEVFTTRPDTLFGATYLVVAPESPVIGNWKPAISNWKEVEAYIEEASYKTELMRQEGAKDKTGVELKGIRAINPATNEKIPIWVADYVLGSYGTGSIMAVPAHDERDFEFAKKFKLPIREVIQPLFRQTEGFDRVQEHKPLEERDVVVAIVKHWKEEKYLGLRWKKQEWRTFVVGGTDGESPEVAALREIKEETGYQHIRFVRNIRGTVHAQFFAAHKNVNRWAWMQGVYCELIDGKQKELEETEKNLHELVWLTKDEVASFLKKDEMTYLWESFLGHQQAYSRNGILTNSLGFDGMDSEKAKWEIVKFVGATRKVHYKLRDWSVARQRYWGVPIPMIYCVQCGIVPVPEKDLPVVLPDLKEYRPKGMPPLASSKEFLNVPCPQCKGNAQRAAETLDTFVDSSWYFLRYTDPHNDKAFADKKRLAYWMPVDLYVIGAEHTVLHLLYSRFIIKFLCDEGYLNFSEPFLKLRHVGLILGTDNQKMSKSKGNVVNPDELVAEFGADAVRLYEMFMGPFEDGQPWDPKGVVGTERFLKKVWNLSQKVRGKREKKAKTDKELTRLLHKTIKKVGEDIAEFRFNTAVSVLMIFVNACEREAIAPVIWSDFIKLLYPFAPHIAEELWEMMGNQNMLVFEPWPQWDAAFTTAEEVTIVIQINGKVRDSITVVRGADEAAVRAAAFAQSNIKKWTEGKKVGRVIFVKDRLINVVLID